MRSVSSFVEESTHGWSPAVWDQTSLDDSSLKGMTRLLGTDFSCDQFQCFAVLENILSFSEVTNHATETSVKN